MTNFRIFTFLLKACSILSVLSLCLVIWSKYLEPPFLYYQNLPFPSTVLQVRAGEAIPISVERCSTSNVSETYLTTHTLLHEATQTTELLPDVTLSIEPGCHRSISLINRIPAKMAAGRYLVQGLALVPGTFETHKVNWYSESFDVVAAEGAKAGPPGPTGATGKAGATGATGATGAAGATGAKGSFWGNGK